MVRGGSSTRVIDLPGEARIIRKIEFTYTSLRLRRAEVVVWGRKIKLAASAQLKF